MFLKGLAGVSATSHALAAAAHQVQFPANRAFPGEETEQRPDLLLHETFAGKTAHVMRPALGTNYRIGRRSSLSECTGGHQQTTSEGLEQTYYAGMANRRNLTQLSLQVIEDSFSFNRTSPFIASPEIARANVRDAFRDSGRSSRIPTFFAYSLNAISTSYRIST